MVTADKRHETAPCSWAAVLLTFTSSMYGVSYLLNVSAEEPGVGAGVLFRALEPLEGINLMERRRKTSPFSR